MSATLTDALTALKQEVGLETAPGTNLSEDRRLSGLLKRTQEALYGEWFWPHLLNDADVALQLGVTVYDFPADINPQRLREVVAVDALGYATAVERGIGAAQLNRSNPARGDRSDPAQCWDMRSDGSGRVRLMVWPAPASYNRLLRFHGLRPLRPLLQPADFLDLDLNLVVLFAAVRELARTSPKEAGIVGQLARQRLMELKSNSQDGQEIMAMAGDFLSGGGTRLPPDRWPEHLD